MISIYVPGPPQGKARARTVRQGNFVHSYTPEKTVVYENLIKVLAVQEMSKIRESIIKGPIFLKIVAYYPVPKSVSNSRRTQMTSGKLKPCKKPDADNIAKVVSDALNGIVYEDDSQICDLNVKKLYTVQEPGVYVYIDRLDSE